LLKFIIGPICIHPIAACSRTLKKNEEASSYTPGKKNQERISKLSHHSGREGERGIAPDRQKEADLRKDRG
jgi:hypothetical protein